MRIVIVISILAVILFVGGSLWSRSLQSNDGDVISASGLHWHVHLSILSDGEPVAIPANIGIGSTHQPIHTHDEDAGDGVVHLEFDGAVRASDVRLGNFFQVWGKDMGTAFGTLESMTVNGATSTAYENYEMQNGDNIILRYE